MKDILDPEKEQLQDENTILSSPASPVLSISSAHAKLVKRDPEKVLSSQLEPAVSQPTARRTVLVGTAGTCDPGFEIDWDGEDDPQNPQNWSSWYKALVVGTLSWSTWVVVLYSTTYTTGILQMQEEFHIESEPVVTLGVTTYLFGSACGTLFMAPLSEMYGRRPVYLAGMLIFLVLLIPCGIGTSLVEVLVVRFFGAAAGSALIANAPGSIGDISNERNRGLVFSIWSIGPLNGPVFGPIIGGFTTQYLGWRWTNWLVMILSGVALVLLFVTHETYAPAILTKKARKRRAETDDPSWWCRYEQKDSLLSLLRINLLRPFVMAFTEPICIFWNLYVSLIYGILYLCFVAYPIVFMERRGWSISFSGLAFIGIGTGSMSAILLEPLIRRMINSHKNDPATGSPPLEAVMSVVCISAVLVPIGQLWFAWTSAPPIHWIWPILAGIPFGGGTIVIFIYGVNYLVNAYGRYAASALVGNTVMRSLLGAVLPLAGPSMYQSLGPHWAGSLLGFLQVAFIPIPFLFYLSGAKLRTKSTLIAQLRDDQQRLEGKRRSRQVEPESSVGMIARDKDIEANVKGSPTATGDRSY